jgi:hypothetical protein
VSDADHADPPVPGRDGGSTGGTGPPPDPAEFDALPGFEVVPTWALAAIVLGLTVLTGSMLLLALASIAVMYCCLARGDDRDRTRLRSTSRRSPGSPGRPG